MKLLHGTSSSNAANISVNGILPRKIIGSEGNWNSKNQVMSLGELVYLTNVPKVADFYSLRAAINDGSDLCVTIEVDVDATYLYPDENVFIEDVNRPIPPEEMQEAKSKVMDHQHLWKKSLDEKGLVSHFGGINKIVKQERKPIEKNAYFYLVEHDRTKRGFDRMFNYEIALAEAGYMSCHDEFRRFEPYDNTFQYFSTTVPYGVIIRE